MNDNYLMPFSNFVHSVTNLDDDCAWQLMWKLVTFHTKPNLIFLVFIQSSLSHSIHYKTHVSV
jgi:hypothetical protein